MYFQTIHSPLITELSGEYNIASRIPVHFLGPFADESRMNADSRKVSDSGRLLRNPFCQDTNLIESIGVIST